MPTALTANQLVAYNLMRIRKALGLSQEQAAERLERYMGVRWSKAVYSAAERSFANSTRVRQFTADDLTAMALAFSVPVIYFWLPPRPEDRGDASGVTSDGQVLSWSELFAVTLGGQPASIVSRLDELAAEDAPSDSVRDVLNLLAMVGVGMTYRQVKAPAAPPAIVAAIVVSDRGVLVGRRRDGRPPWTFIAGEQEPGERPEDTAVREVKEETGLRVKVGAVIGERVHPNTGRQMIYMAAAPTHGTDVFVGDEVELAEVRWVGVAEADDLLPGMFEPVREYLTRKLGEATR